MVAQAGADEKVHQADRERLLRIYLTRTVVLLREAIDSNPKLAERSRPTATSRSWRRGPEFQAIMNTLVEGVQ